MTCLDISCSLVLQDGVNNSKHHFELFATVISRRLFVPAILLFWTQEALFGQIYLWSRPLRSADVLRMCF